MAGLEIVEDLDSPQATRDADLGLIVTRMFTVTAPSTEWGVKAILESPELRSRGR